MAAGKDSGVFARNTWVVLLLNALICSIVAVLVWAAFPYVGKSGLFSSWVYSQSIGQIICIGFLVFSHFQQTKSLNPAIGYFLFYPIIVFFGFFLGKNLAAYLMKTPVDPHSTGPVFWTTLFITFCVSLFAIWFFSSRDKMMNLKLIAAEESARASKAKLSMLQAQVEPHMLFNTLSNLRLLISSDATKATLMLDNLVDYLRSTLANSMHESTLLKNEFELLENYLSLMEIRIGHRLKFDLHLPSNLEQQSVPILILQPIVENAIKHGIEPSVQGGIISIHARSEEHCIAVEVIDTGIGYNQGASPPQHEGSEGFGLHSVRERLQTTDTPYEVLSVMSPLSDGQQGTSITIRLPLSSKALQKSSRQ